MKTYILAITPNPSLDIGGFVNNLMPNEKSYVHNQTKSPGGNAINAARILSRLEASVLATGYIGGGVGEEIKFLLDEENVNNNFFKIKDHSRICVTVSNKKDHYQTRLNFPGPKILNYEKQALFKFIEKQPNVGLIILGGSFPTGFDISDAKKILNIALKRKIPCVVDCPSLILKELISEKPFFIKPNLHEFQEALNFKGKSIADVNKKAKSLLGKIPFICISSVEGGALFVTKNNSYFGRIPKIKIKSTVGAGDSMVGAMVDQFVKKNKSEQDTLRWGLAAAAATLSLSGTTLGSKKEIYKLYQKTKVKVIS